MEKHKKMFKKVLQFLDDNHYSRAVINGTTSCFNTFEAHLLLTQKVYTPKVGDEWFYSIEMTLSKTYMNFYKNALIKLQDVYETGDVRQKHNPKALRTYTMLNTNLKDVLDLYISEFYKTVSHVTANNHKNRCARFLIFVQKKGVKNISDISYELICSFYDEDIHSGRTGKGNVNGSISTMMEYLYNKGKVPYGFTIILHYISYGKGCFWNDVDNIVHEKIKVMQKLEELVSVEVLHKYQLISQKVHVENEYSKPVRSTNKKALDLLILFLDTNGYAYSSAISLLWFDNLKDNFATEFYSFHRALCIIAEYHNSSKIKLDTTFRINPSSFAKLPQWCKEVANNFMKTYFPDYYIPLIRI